MTGRRAALVAMLVMVGLLAVIGVVQAARVLFGPGPDDVGRELDTGFGSFMVTRVSTSAVPDTQGPPSAAQHNGAVGSIQVQLAVQYANTKAASGVGYDPALVRLLPAGGGRPVTPVGSTLKAGTLARGAEITGQIWFEPGAVDPGRLAGAVLEVPDGARVLRVRLSGPQGAG